MARLKIESSSIESIDYDIKEGILIVEFKRGNIYRFFNIDSEEVVSLLFSDSIGSYFYKNISKREDKEKIKWKKI